VAIAATLVLGLSIVFKAGVPELDKVPEVTIENVAQRLDYPAAPVSEAPATQGPVVVDLASPTQNIPTLASHEDTSPPAAAPPPPAPPVLARGEVAKSLRAGAPMDTASAPGAAPTPMSADVPAWRRDSKTWQAEIDRLRASGDDARANAELAEFNRQHRAYAVAPDR
jgi:hypothetical protein